MVTKKKPVKKASPTPAKKGFLENMFKAADKKLEEKSQSCCCCNGCCSEKPKKKK